MSISSTPQKLHSSNPITTTSNHNSGARSSVSSRWNPTAKQLQVLENMYRSGTHTPTTEQIKQITTQLSKFGKIEGKNVFYWFQNHKARERQKRRRKLGAKAKENENYVQKNESGSRKMCFEEGNCTIPLEETVSMNKAAIVENNTGNEEIEERRKVEWHVVVPYSTSANLRSTMNKTTWPLVLVPTRKHSANSEDQCRQIQTLELFPLQSNRVNGSTNVNENESKMPFTSLNHKITPNQFFEFLPLKK